MGQSEAIAAHHVVEIIEEPRKETPIKEKHNVIAATVLGVIQIICGIVALGVFIARIVVHDNTCSFNNSILISILFFVSGMLTLGRVYTGNKWLLVASMVMAAASTLVAVFLLVHAGLSRETGPHGFSCSFDPGYGNTSYTGYYSEFQWEEQAYINTDYTDSADIWADNEDLSYHGNSSNSSKEDNNGNQSYNYRYMEDMVIVVLAWTMLIAGTVSALFTCFTHLRPSMQSKLQKSGRLAAENNLN